jgi:centromere-localized protein 2
MPSPEAVILTDFLLAPAALRDVLTLQQFTEIFPKSHRLGPAVKELYQELQRLRNEDLETVRLNIQDEIKKSRTLKRDCARERELDDRRAVAGLDPTILDREEQVC